MKQILSLIIASLLFNAGFAQDKEKGKVEEAITAKKYIFKARTALPLSGGTRQLNSSYDLTLRNDTLIAYLPYFGRAYNATIGRTTSGIDFTSTKFTYKVTEGKKGGWTIFIEPKDVDDVRQLSLNLSKNGYGTLHVTNQNRQPISYTGAVEPLDQSK
jgi:hypothetical protein